MKGLYIHIPFCIKKCRYCDFNSFSFVSDDVKQYLPALFSEMKAHEGDEFDTIFIGGGTPTALDADELELVLQKIKSYFVLSENCEFTIEANPKTVDERKLDTLLENGVNRISVGVQSFNDSELLTLGRIHTAKEAMRTLFKIRHAGFKNINIDLMSAVPNQTLESFNETLNTALDFEPEHISCYSLILEPGTPLYTDFEKGKLVLPDEAEEREIYDYALKTLESNGFKQYEISNFAKKGFESKHNMKYWKCEEYVGLGLGAHSYEQGIRYSNTDNFFEYTKGNFASGEREILTKQDMMSEFMFMGLRMTEGVSKSEFLERFGIPVENIFEKPLLKFKDMGMLIEENGKIRLSRYAIDVSNSIMCEFIL